MVTRRLFGIFVFDSNSSLTYRFLTDDLFEYLRKCTNDRYELNDNLGENNQNNEEPSYTLDDIIGQYFSTLINFFTLTVSHQNSIKRMKLQSNTEVFFDQIGESKILCMVDDSFDTLLVLKTINLFKALVEFHLGALSFPKSGDQFDKILTGHRMSETIHNLIVRISASLQYYLNDITKNQALLFESCEYLHINTSIRQQCYEACTTINRDVQHWLNTTPTLIFIMCKDKIVHMHMSNERHRPSNSDLFLLLLNHTSRSLRDQFQIQQNNSTNKMAHTYKTTKTDDKNRTLINPFQNSFDNSQVLLARRTHSLPTFTNLESVKSNSNRRIEVVFMKTSNRNLAPFTMYTIPLTNHISAVFLVEWKTSLPCSHLFDLIRQIDYCTNQLRFSYNRLNNFIKPLENNTVVQRYLKHRKFSIHTLSNTLNEIQSIHKSTSKTVTINEDEERKKNQILTKLTKMNKICVATFHHLFFESDEFVISKTNDQQKDFSNENDNSLQLSMAQVLQNNLSKQLTDCFSFIEIKAQRNFTMSFCHNDFPGLVHFAFIDRFRGRICTPSLYSDDYENYLIINNENEQILEKKIFNFELECLSALQRGCTSYTITDEHFTYNYALRLQERNGASMRLYKSFVKTNPPGILFSDFYKELARENYSSLSEQTSIACFELVCVHLCIVPPSNVREQCEQLWPRLMELDE